MSYVFLFTFFHCRWSFSTWWPLAFLIFSPPLQNFHVVLSTTKMLSPRANALSIVGQQLPTLLDVTYFVRLYSCCAKFETGQTFSYVQTDVTTPNLMLGVVGPQCCIRLHTALDCKAVRIFAYSSKCEQSNKRSGTRLKMESETGELFFTGFEKKTDRFAV